MKCSNIRCIIVYENELSTIPLSLLTYFSALVSSSSIVEYFKTARKSSISLAISNLSDSHIGVPDWSKLGQIGTKWDKFGTF